MLNRFKLAWAILLGKRDIEFDSLKEIVMLSSKCCGHNVCNCPGSFEIIQKVDAYLISKGLPTKIYGKR